MRTGCPWRDLPASFGKFQAVYNCFNRWSKKGIIQGIFKKLSTDTDKEWLMSLPVDDPDLRVVAGQCVATAVLLALSLVVFCRRSLRAG